MLNYLKKIFSIFLIFNLTFVSSAQAAATFVDSFDVSTQEANSAGVVFNNDGTKMFVIGNTGDDVNEYTLTTPFDVSTATFNDFNGNGRIESDFKYFSERTSHYFLKNKTIPPTNIANINRLIMIL